MSFFFGSRLAVCLQNAFDLDDLGEELFDALNQVYHQCSQVDPNLAQAYSHFSQVNPNCMLVYTHVCQVNPNFGQVYADAGQVNPHISHVDPNFGHVYFSSVEQLFDRNSPHFSQLEPNFGLVYPRFSQATPNFSQVDTHFTQSRCQEMTSNQKRQCHQQPRMQTYPVQESSSGSDEDDSENGSAYEFNDLEDTMTEVYELHEIQ